MALTRAARAREPTARAVLALLAIAVVGHWAHALRVPFINDDYVFLDKVRSQSQGRASWTMEPKAYAPVPDDVLQAMLHPEDYA